MKLIRQDYNSYCAYHCTENTHRLKPRVTLEMQLPYQLRPNLTKWKASRMWESGRKWSKIFKKKNRNLNQVLGVRSLKHTLKGSFFKHVERATGRFPTREHALGS